MKAWSALAGRRRTPERVNSRPRGVDLPREQALRVQGRERNVHPGIRSNGRLPDPFSDVGTWVVSGGTGKYVKLEGAGSLVGSPTDTGVLDSFTGMVGITN